MATYPIFTQDGGQRIAVNPDSVTSVIEVERGRVVINLPDGGSATISMSLETVVGRSRVAANWNRLQAGGLKTPPIRLAPRPVVEWTRSALVADAPPLVICKDALGSKIWRSDCAARRSFDHNIVGCARGSLDDRSHRAARRRMALSVAIDHRRCRWPHLDGRS
jgi:hypothetical protein